MNSMKGLALVVALLVVANAHQTGHAQNKSRKKEAKAKPMPARVMPQAEEVPGNGETADKARETARKNAVARVEELLLERFSRGDWQPAARHLDAEYLEEKKVIQPAGETKIGPGVVGDVNFTAMYRVELTTEYMNELVKEARVRKVEERHLVLGRVVFAILALALVTAGYLRLEEMSRGYATKLLRLAAVVLLAIVGAGLYLTR